LLQLLVFRLDDRRCAVPLQAVQRVVRAVDVTPLAGAPEAVLGVIDVAGQVVPVLSPRRRLAMPDRAIGPEDAFILAQAGPRTVALAVDAAQGVIEREAGAVVPPERIAPGLEHVRGVTRCEDGLVLIHDLARFLSLDETRRLDHALERTA
jgi:purine-binding chemotaxis protein CheW